MNEAEKQDSRKTIIAFGAGLLIGALLVWAFTSATMNNDENNNQGANVSDTSEDVDNDNMSDDDDDASMDTDDNDDVSTTPTTGDEISVSDQPAGSVVVLGDVNYEGRGWVAVGDYVDGDSVRFLGAARFDTSLGLEPTEVPLLRATEAGETYRVALFMENGDGDFSRAGGDMEIEGTATLFQAE